VKFMKYLIKLKEF